MAEPRIIPAGDEEYELLPRKEIEELKEELQRLKEFEIMPTKKLHVSLNELNAKLDKLIAIFEEAARTMRIEEGGMTFAEKMKPLSDKMNKILEQNADIAEGILSLADMIESLGKMKMEIHEEEKLPMPPLPPVPPIPPQTPSQPQKPRTFGL